MIWGPGGTRRYAITVFHNFLGLLQRQACKLPVNTNATTASSDSVRTFLLLRNSCFAFLQILPFSPCTTCNSQASWRNWLWWWWWLELFHTEGQWSEAEQIKKEKKLSNVGRSCRNQQLANSLLFFVVAELHVSLKDTPPKKAAVICRKKNAKMTFETVETVVAAAPYAVLIGHKLRPLLSDSQSALADCEEDVIQICHLLSRNGKLSLVRLTKSFPTIPNLSGDFFWT